MNINDDSDQVLVKKILAGSRSSFEELMKKYNRYIFTYIYRMVRDEETSVELTQEFFIKIYRKLDTYTPEYRFSSWAYRVCYNMVLDYFRKQKAKVDSLDGETVTPRQLMESGHYHEFDGSDTIEKEQLKGYTWSLVDRLPEAYRELILLRYVQGLNYDEIARITQLPLGTVKNKLFKAKKRLKKEIEQDGMLDRYTTP